MSVFSLSFAISHLPLILSTAAERANQNTSPSSPGESVPTELSTIPESSRSVSLSPVKGNTSPRASPVKHIESPEKEIDKDSSPNKDLESGQSPSKTALEDQVETPQEKINQSGKSPQTKPPLPDRKPPVGEKPLVLPKPVLLQKPDKPMQFGMLCCTFFNLIAFCCPV